MRLRILLPSRVLLDREVEKVTAEAANGSFGMLPRHVDFVTSLEAGLVGFVPAEESADDAEQEIFVGVDQGILVKHGSRVQVSVRDATRPGRLGEVRRAAEERFAAMDEHLRKVRSSISRIEASFVRRFMDTQK